MATVQELVDEVAAIMGEPRSRVNQLARNLMENGWLPKSRGRAIAKVEGKHVLPLIASVAFAKQNSDASKVAEVCNLHIIPELTSVRIPRTGKDEIIRKRDLKLEEVLKLNDMIALLLNNGLTGTFELRQFSGNKYSGYVECEIYDGREIEGEGPSRIVTTAYSSSSAIKSFDRAPIYKSLALRERAMTRLENVLWRNEQYGHPEKQPNPVKGRGDG